MKPKRQNFNVTPAQESEIESLRVSLGAPNSKEAVLQAVRLTNNLLETVHGGGRILVQTEEGQREVLLSVPKERWTYLVERPHPWKRQLWIKGRRQAVGALWSAIVSEGQGAEAASEDWDLPIEAIREVFAYAERYRHLIEAEAREEAIRGEIETAA